MSLYCLILHVYASVSTVSTCIPEAWWSSGRLDQQQVREEAPPVLFSWMAQRHYFPIGPLEHTSHLYYKQSGSW